MALIVGTTLFAAVAFTAVQPTEGYEVYKNALENMKNFENGNATIDLSLIVKDNENVVIAMDGNLKMDKEEKAVSGEISIATEEFDKEIDIYGNEDKVIIYDVINDDYYSVAQSEDINKRHKFHRKDSKTFEFSEGKEELLDFFVGDYKNQFEIESLSNGM